MEKLGNTSKQLDALFERVSELSKIQRIMICVGVFVVIFVLFEVGVEVDLGFEVETDERSHLRGHVTVFDRKVTVLGGA